MGFLLEGRSVLGLSPEVGGISLLYQYDITMIAIVNGHRDSRLAGFKRASV